MCGQRIRQKQAQIERPGVRVLAAAVMPDGRIDLAGLMDRLGEENISSLLIEGGSRVIAGALPPVSWTRRCFYAPKILGGDDGVPICAGPGPGSMADCIRLEDIRVSRFEDDILIEGYIRKPEGL